MSEKRKEVKTEKTEKTVKVAGRSRVPDATRKKAKTVTSFPKEQSKLRLFAVNGEFFDNKRDAKEARDGISGGHVSIGPDHWRYGLHGHAKTHSHNAKSGGPGTGYPKRKR